MPTEVESAQLILKLYELRREPLLRQARAWFLSELNPTTFEELVASVSGERNACEHGNGPDVAKVEPFLAEFRRGVPEFLQHLEAVVREIPGSTERLALIREQLRAAAQGRETTPEVAG